MSKKKEDPSQQPEQLTPEQGEEQIQEEAAGASQDACPDGELEQLRSALAQKEDQYLRLAAEYDNFRKRSQKEKDSAWTDARSETVLAFLPVYDNLERALKAPCADEAFLKGVEMTMAGLKEVLAKLGVEEIPALGETFDPNLHNAVMHVEDESAGENTIVEVFQTGFRSGEKIVRFAMVKVAN